MGKVLNVVHGFKPVIIMIVVQAMFAGANIFYKLGANDGMNLRILVAYRFLFAAAFMIPLALYAERKKRPKMTWLVLGQAFFCGLLGGTLAQNLYLTSISLTSATFTVAIANLIPAVTFLLALIFGLEKLGWRTKAGKAKVLGTLMGIGGAMILTFYKGPKFDLSTNVNLLRYGGGHAAAATSSHIPSGKMVLGFAYAFSSCICFALWLILQAKMAERYPCPYTTTAIMNVFASVQGVVFAMCTSRNWNDWKLGWNIRLLIVLYSGVVASGLMFTLIAWCINMRGPLFVSVFNPLMLVIVAVTGALILDENLHLGSLIGAIFIICGLYIVLWGKDKEMKRVARLVPDVNNNNHDSKRIDVVITSSDPATRIDDPVLQGRGSSSPSRIQTIQITQGPIRPQNT